MDSEIRVFDQDEFYAMDERVMGVVFAVHNEFGRLLDETLFKRAIAFRCVAQGIEPAEQEVRIRVTHETFSKDYFIDPLLGHGMMVEAKTVDRLTQAHRAQALNYLLLTGMKHGRLINLRPERVQHEYVSTRLDGEARRRFSVADCGWRELDVRSAWLKRKFLELLQDWGAFLEISLYREAIVHFLGGQDVAYPETEIFDGPQILGCQRVCLLTPDAAFSCTAMTRDKDKMTKHLSRLLAHTRLRFVQWVNLNRACVEFSTIAR
jgi:GxxExxY protein